ncbi:hypothetical protein [Mesorhizobium sp.]|uniref:hypothetical protein n=1 Tax=Mesorhizobium sp. TaxID=1871066 RepID=UPI000FD5AFDA|nr:hypothetical protein [Mesorhizobium sp.]RUV87024.1 hypothetical protein EOA88_14825 [Mesorhizobium sp. M5C.F.Ca.IN.020.14.1.1]RWI36082.1 MAG: hypothetical protein EOR14_27700 [Mesorhizobium sp.]RWI63092.1 MAG: hypothetical protein EOR17_30010 [Mesorhizobium sp.]RWJ25332.1 MAG: hypothetical protein EOR28_28455 [Mesorhizobium sp.]RWP98757.1 MAG: hypothetical protein EOR89_18835 [Mesorhizobium sp.]
MPDPASPTREVSLPDTMERIRAERFPHLDRDLVREILRLHAESGSAMQGLSRAVDEVIAARLGESV